MRGERGFTLLEVLAALVVLALAAAALAEALTTRARLAGRLEQGVRLSAAATLLLDAHTLGPQVEAEVRATLHRAGIRITTQPLDGEDGPRHRLVLERQGRRLELVLPGEGR